MSAPGNSRTVGSVSIKVMPDTTRFRQQLRDDLRDIERTEELNIPVKFDPDVADLRAKLAQLDNSRITIPVDLELGPGQIAQLQAQLQGITGVRIPVDLDLSGTDVAALEAALSALDGRSINIRISVDGVALAIAELQALELLVDRLDGRQININVDMDIGAALAQIAALQAAIAGLRTVNLGGGFLGGGAGGANPLAAVAGLVTGYLKLTAIATGLAVAGAAVTAAWGAAATAIAAIPAALFLVAGPLAAVAVGLDGIKKAAQTIKPELDKLKASVSATFERGFIPVFKQLQGIFPTLTTGLNEVATAISGTALQLATFLTQEPQLQALSAVFTQVGLAIQAISPGLQDIVAGILAVGAQSGAFTAITSAVNTFGAAFKASVLDLLSDTTLMTAFEGLRGVLDSLTIGFVQLVDNGIRVFAAAAPGVKTFLDDLTGFFERFDWASLGASVGGVFRGLGEAIRGIPQGVIDGIAASFSRLATTFQDPGFQASLQNIASALPAAIDAMNNAAKDFAAMASLMADAVKGFQGADQGFRTFVDGILAEADRLGQKLGVGEGTPVSKWLTEIDDDIDRFLGILPPKVGELGANVGTEGVTSTNESFTAIVDEFFKGGKNVESAATSATAGVAGAAQSGMEKVPAAAAKGLEPLSPTAIAIINKLAPDITTAMRGLGAVAQLGMVTVADGFVQGGRHLSAGMTTALQGLGPILSAGLTALAPLVTEGMSALQTSINTSLLEIREAFRVGFDGLGLIVQTAFANLAPFIASGMLAIVASINTSLLEIREAFRVGFEGIGLIVQQAFINLAPFVAEGMLGIVAAINTKILEIREAFTIGFQGVAEIVRAGFALTGVAATEGMFAMQTAINTKILEIRNAFTIGWQGIAEIVRSGFTLAAATATEGMTAIQLAINTKILEIREAFNVGFQGVAEIIRTQGTAMGAAMQAAMTTIQTATTEGMTAVQVAINTGMIESRRSVDVGVQGMVSRLQAAVPEFRAAGANMGQALADGLNSKAGVVEAAAARLAAAAAAATRAAAGIRSPSRVFMNLGDLMGQGLAVGLEDSKPHLIRAAATLTDALETQFERADLNLDPGLSKWADQLDAGVARSMVETSPQMETVSAGVGSAGPAVGTINVYNPVAERASNSIAQKQRELAELGVFARA